MDIAIRQDTILPDAALAAVKAAVEKGLSMGCRVNCAVVDAGGNLVAFFRAHGAFLHSIHIAQDKAYTAVSFGIPTAQLYERINGAAQVRDGLLQRDRLVAIGGGLPITLDGRVIGGIGVSGASEEQDTLCAQAGLSALGVAV